MKQIKRSLLLLSFLIFFWVPSFVWADNVTVDDQSGLFTPEEVTELNQLAQEINQKIKGEVFIVTTNSNTSSPETFADNYLRERIGNDQNGAVLLLDMGQREIYLSTSGNMIDYITDKRLNTILDEIYNAMSASDYGLAGRIFLTRSLEYVEAGVPKGQYRNDRDTGKITYYKVLTPFEALLSLLFALLISGVFFLVIKSRYQLKMGTYKYPFLEKANFSVGEKDDKLIHSFVTTRRIPKPSSNDGGGSGGGGSTTHSSGGGTFGGGGRSF